MSLQTRILNYKVKLAGGLMLTSAAGAGKVLVSDAEGNGTWGEPGGAAIAEDLGGTTAAPKVVNLHLSGNTAISHKLTSVTDPTEAQDAATKKYADTKMGWNGAWSGASLYILGSVVTYEGSAYVCIKAANENHKPNTETTWWTLIGEGNGAATVGMAYRNAAQSITGNERIKLDKVIKDPNSLFELTGSFYKVPREGYYQVSGQVNVTDKTANSNVWAEIRVNEVVGLEGTKIESKEAELAMALSVSGIVFCKAGDKIELWGNAATGSPLVVGVSKNYLCVVRVA